MFGYKHLSSELKLLLESALELQVTQATYHLLVWT